MYYHPQQLTPGAAKAAEGVLELLPNQPNPFIEMTMLRFNLSDAAQVVLRIFDGQGREINHKTAAFTKGENHLVLQRHDLKEPGIYEYLIESEGHKSQRRKLVMF